MSSTSQKSFNTNAQRQASFDVTHSRKRSSSVKGPKNTHLRWPPENPSPSSMAAAGFYYKPTLKSPDNVACFLCQKNLDGWDPQDNPAAEHLVHTEGCGWAITMCISRSQRLESLSSSPSREVMKAAREATFSKWWPHENKKGWMAKIPDLAEAGFVYAPTLECDDRVVCPFCDIAVENWEPRDHPRDEHVKKRVDCPFLTFDETLASGSRRSSITSSNLEDDTLDGNDKQKGKRSRVQKSKSSNPRKRKIPRSNADPEEYQNMVLGDGIPNDEHEANIGNYNMRTKPENDIQTPKTRPMRVHKTPVEATQEVLLGQPKRRLTRASIAAGFSDLQLHDIDTVQKSKAIIPKEYAIGQRFIGDASTQIVPQDDGAIDMVVTMDLERSPTDVEEDKTYATKFGENDKDSVTDQDNGDHAAEGKASGKLRRRLTKTKPECRLHATTKQSRSVVRKKTLKSPSVDVAVSIDDTQPTTYNEPTERSFTSQDETHSIKDTSSSSNSSTHRSLGVAANQADLGIPSPIMQHVGVEADNELQKVSLEISYSNQLRANDNPHDIDTISDNTGDVSSFEDNGYNVETYTNLEAPMDTNNGSNIRHAGGVNQNVKVADLDHIDRALSHDEVGTSQRESEPRDSLPIVGYKPATKTSNDMPDSPSVKISTISTFLENGTKDDSTNHDTVSSKRVEFKEAEVNLRPIGTKRDNDLLPKSRKWENESSNTLQHAASSEFVRQDNHEASETVDDNHQLQDELFRPLSWIPVHVNDILQDQKLEMEPFEPSMRDDERQLTLASWIDRNALLAEERVLATCEEIVTVFEAEGKRALSVLEAINVKPN